MLKFAKSPVMGPFLAAVLLLFPLQSWSQELPEGVTWTVVAVYKVDTPGVDRVELGKFTMEPGATMTEAMEANEFCSVTQGTFTVVNHDLGTTTVYSAGSRFSSAKGQKVTASNLGDTLAVQWVYQLFSKE